VFAGASHSCMLRLLCRGGKSQVLNEQEKRVSEHPSFRLLVAKRRKIRFLLTALLLGLYLAFSLAAVYAPDFLATPLSNTSVVPIGIAIGYAIIMLAIVVAGYYVHVANTGFAKLEQEVERDLGA